MNLADGVPVFLGVLGGLAVGAWTLADRLQAMAHDRAIKRLEAEEQDHDATRRELADAKRRLVELEARRAPQPPPG